MPDREKVMRGLKACHVEEDGCVTLCKVNGCPYNGSHPHCMTKLHEDALALLKEQEPRVMMKEEIVLCTDWVWCEYTSGYQGWYKIEEYVTDYGIIRWEDTTAEIVDDYGFRWRAWTSRPTEEQRKAVPWNE